MSVLTGSATTFVEAFGTLAPIVNPLGCALLYPRLSRQRTHEERLALARRIAINAGLVLLVAMWAGAAIMSLLGIGLPALRTAGGLVITIEAWRLLAAAPDETAVGEDGAFVPLTIPFTTGPGTLAAAISIGESRPAGWDSLVAHVAGASVAAVAVAGAVWLAYARADRIMALLGPAGCRSVTRLSAFVLLCLGVQILCRGLRNSFS